MIHFHTDGSLSCTRDVRRTACCKARARRHTLATIVTAALIGALAGYVTALWQQSAQNTRCIYVSCED